MAQQQKNNSPESIVKHMEDIFRLAKTSGPIKNSEIAKLDKNVLSIIIGALSIKQSEVFLKTLFGKEHKKIVKPLKLKPKSSLQIDAIDPTMKQTVGKLYGAYIEIDHFASVAAETPKFDHLTNLIVYKGEISEIERLLKLNSHLLNAVDERGFCPLAIAAEVGRLDVVHLLLSKKCDTRLTLKDGANSLHKAALVGHTSIVEALLNADPDLINLQMTNGTTPLIFAAQSGHLDTAMLLLSKKCDTRLTFGDENALHIAAKNRHPEVVSALLDADNGLIDTFNDEGSALHLAALKCPEIVDVLLSKKCDPKIKAKDGKLALHVAAQTGNLSAVSALVRADSDSVNTEDELGHTPAQEAAYHSQSTVLQFLIENGCDMNAVDHNDWTLLHAAVQKGDLQTAIYLLTTKPELINQQTKGGLTALYFAVTYGHIDLINLLLKQKANVDLCDNDGGSVLHVAVQKGHEKIVSMLLSQYPALAKKKTNAQYGFYTALSVAIFYKQKNIIPALLQADPEAVSTTPILSEATVTGDVDIVELVLEKKPSPAQIIAAFKQAITDKQLPIINILKKHVPDSAWFEILQIATILGRQGILARLLTDPQVKLKRDEVRNLLDLAGKAKPRNKGICNVLSQKLKQFPKPESLSGSTDSSTSLVLSTFTALPQAELETETTAADSKSVDEDIDKSITQAQQFYRDAPAVADELEKIAKQRAVYAAFIELMRKSQGEKHRRYSGKGLEQFGLMFSPQNRQQSEADQRKAELAELGYFEVLDAKRAGNFFVMVSEDAMTKVPAPVQHKITAELTKGTKFDRPGLVLLAGKRKHPIYELSLPKEDGRLIGYMAEKDQVITLRSGITIKNARVITLCEYAATHADISHTADLLDKSLSRGTLSRHAQPS